MKLKELHESRYDSLPNLNEFLDDVSHYLDMCMTAGKNQVLWHGSSQLQGHGYLHDFRFRNWPRDTPQHIFDSYNEWTKKHYGIEPRKWLFCYTESRVPGEYGAAHAIFPVGKFDWFKIEGVEDFYIEYSQKIRNNRNNSEEEIFKYMMDEAQKEDRIIYNTKFDSVISGYGEEVMIFGTKFYALQKFDLSKMLDQDADKEFEKYVMFLRDMLKSEDVK